MQWISKCLLQWISSRQEMIIHTGGASTGWGKVKIFLVDSFWGVDNYKKFERMQQKSVDVMIWWSQLLQGCPPQQRKMNSSQAERLVHLISSPWGLINFWGTGWLLFFSMVKIERASWINLPGGVENWKTADLQRWQESDACDSANLKKIQKEVIWFNRK